MLTKGDIKVFDFIYSINIEDKYNLLEKEKRLYINDISSMFDDQEDEYSFWMSKLFMVNKGSVFDATDITSGHHAGYTDFPKMTFDAKEIYLEYKKNEFLEKIKDNGGFNRDIIGKVFKNMPNIAIKELLDYFEKEGILTYSGQVYLAADDNPAYEIMYDNISYIKKDNKPNAGPIQNNLSFNGPTILNNSRINQAINYSNVNDSIFETVNKLLFEIKDIKSIDNKIVKDLEQAEKSKSKSKLVDLLVGIASNSTSSILLYSAKGILASLGIFI